MDREKYPCLFKKIPSHPQLHGSLLPVAGHHFFLCANIGYIITGHVIYNISQSRQFVALEEISLETKELWCTQGQRSIYDTFKDIAGQSQDGSSWEREASCKVIAKFSPGTKAWWETASSHSSPSMALSPSPYYA